MFTKIVVIALAAYCVEVSGAGENPVSADRPVPPFEPFKIMEICENNILAMRIHLVDNDEAYRNELKEFSDKRDGNENDNMFHTLELMKVLHDSLDTDENLKFMKLEPAAVHNIVEKFEADAQYLVKKLSDHHATIAREGTARDDELKRRTKKYIECDQILSRSKRGLRLIKAVIEKHADVIGNNEHKALHALNTALQVITDLRTNLRNYKYIPSKQEMHETFFGEASHHLNTAIVHIKEFKGFLRANPAADAERKEGK